MNMKGILPSWRVRRVRPGHPAPFEARVWASFGVPWYLLTPSGTYGGSRSTWVDAFDLAQRNAGRDARLLADSALPRAAWPAPTLHELTGSKGLNLGSGVRLTRAPGGGYSYTYDGPKHP